MLAKLLLTVFATILLLGYMQTASFIATLAADTAFSGDDILTRRTPSARLYAAGGLVVLILILTLAMHKPRGVTRYGWRKQHEQGASTPP